VLLDLEGLGDDTCSQADCETGKELVTTMQQFYQAAVDTKVGGADFVKKYNDQVNVLVGTLNIIYDSASSNFPGMRACCSVKDLGLRAQSVINDMQNDVGSHIGNTPSLVNVGIALLPWIAFAAFVGAGVWYVRRHARRSAV
jgi:hypothetical protein